MKWLWSIVVYLSLCVGAWAQASCPVTIDAVQAAPALSGGQYPDDSAWINVTLPDDGWQHFPKGAERDARTGLDGIWYRIDWQRGCQKEGATPVALVLRSIVLAGEVYINHEQIWSDDSLIEPLSRSWNIPRILRFPEPLLRDGSNSVYIRVVSVPGQPLGLGEVSIGPAAAMQQRYEELKWHSRTVFAVNLIVSGVLGVFFLALWVAHRNETAYGWYALSTFFWLIFAFSIVAGSIWPFTETASAVRVYHASLVLSIACFCVFTWRFSAQKLPRLERALWSFTLVALLILFVTPFTHARIFHSIVVFAVTLVFLSNCVWIPFHAWRTRHPEHILLAVCLAALLVIILHDFLLLNKVISSSRSILPYANIAVTLCLAGIMGFRHANNVRRIERFNHELRDAVATAQSELASTLEQKYGLALSNTRLQDRLQLAHDLHDGMGGSLLHIMATVEQSPSMLQRERVLSMLKLLRDDLRQTIDSSSSEGIEAPATPKEWIAPLRHRFSMLFDHFDIRNTWQLPDSWFARPNAMQCLVLTRLLEEGLTNVVRHSHAEQVHIKLEHNQDSGLSLSIEDDGVGFDVEAVQQASFSVGMRSMHARMLKIGGVLEISSQRGKTVLVARVKK